MLNERPYQIIIELTALHSFCFNMVLYLLYFIYFLMYLSFSLAAYEGAVRRRFSVVLSYYLSI